jgi:predicted ArsR family transcriptional regulator
MPNRADDIEAVALLDEPVRRALYEWVVAQGEPVGRDAAAAAVGVARSLAAFHLDRLVREGLLVPQYRRLTGRTGPGAGRPAKLYARGEREVAVSLPERRYDVAAELLVEALEELDGDGSSVLLGAADRLGRAAGAAARERIGPDASADARDEALRSTLTERGYEPIRDDGTLRYANCPFHALVEDHRDVVCRMNLAIAEGLLDGLGDDPTRARLDPLPNRCCVAIEDAARD